MRSERGLEQAVPELDPPLGQVPVEHHLHPLATGSKPHDSPPFPTMARVGKMKQKVLRRLDEVPSLTSAAGEKARAFCDGH
jgi:hypothetical protein